KIVKRQPDHLREIRHRGLSDVICQLVFVVKLTAVLNARCSLNGPSPCGLSGNKCCKRRMAYVNRQPTKLKSNMASVYCFQSCSLLESTPIKRYVSRSNGRSTGSNQVLPSA